MYINQKNEQNQSLLTTLRWNGPLIFVYESTIMQAVKITNLLKKKYLLYFFVLAVFFLFYSLAVYQIKLFNSSKKTSFNSFLN